MTGCGGWVPPYPAAVLDKPMRCSTSNRTRRYRDLARRGRVGVRRGQPVRPKPVQHSVLVKVFPVLEPASLAHQVGCRHCWVHRTYARPRGGSRGARDENGDQLSTTNGTQSFPCKKRTKSQKDTTTHTHTYTHAQPKRAVSSTQTCIKIVAVQFHKHPAP